MIIKLIIICNSIATVCNLIAKHLKYFNKLSRYCNLITKSCNLVTKDCNLIYKLYIMFNANDNLLWNNLTHNLLRIFSDNLLEIFGYISAINFFFVYIIINKV